MKLKIALLLLVAAVIAVACRDTDVATPAVTSSKPLYYTCPMHPPVKANQPGDCPICGMKLVPVYAATTSSPATSEGAGCCSAPGPAAKP